MEINRIYNMDCIDGLKLLDTNSVDLTVTSPPYDNLRTYHEGDEFKWDFEIFKPIANELYRVTKPGGIVVWIVGDATIDGDETGTSFKQALYFKECGFKLHDTMIYEKNGSSRPASKNAKRYSQIFEYMFVFVKGEIRKDITLIADKRNKWAGWAKWGKNTTYDIDGNLVEVKKNQPVIKEYSYRNNIWRYSVSFNDKTGHPAVFPELLAQDNILSWSVEGDLVLDPFMGSGTTAKMAKLNKRNYIGFEKSTEYYQKSLERIAKYDGQVNTNLDITNEAIVTYEDGEKEKLGEETQYSTLEDKEFEKKSKLWDELVGKLETYFNEQTYGTLKSLQFNFVTKTNDNRVKQINQQEDVVKDILPNAENQQRSQVPEDVTVSQTISDVEQDITIPNYVSSDDEMYHQGLIFNEFKKNVSSTIDKEYIKNIVYDIILNDYEFPTMSSIINSNELKEHIISVVGDYFPGMKRLPDAIVEVNKKARQAKKLQEKLDKKLEKKTKTIDVTVVEGNTKNDEQLTEDDMSKIIGIELADVVDGKPVYNEPIVVKKRKRRTKAEMEAARNADLNAAIDSFIKTNASKPVVESKRGRGRPRKIKD